MSGEGVMSVMQVCLMCIFSSAAGSPRYKYGNFTLLPGQTLGHGYKSVDGASPAFCGATCSAEDQCVAVTFNPDTGQCNLNDKNPLDYPVDIISNETTALLVAFGRIESCPPGWDLFNRHCYLFSSDERTWVVANNECINRQALLVSVNDAVEYSFVVQKLHEYSRIGAWVGMNNVHGARTWADGQRLSYSKFRPGDPDNAEGTQDCLRIALDSNAAYGMDDAWCNVGVQTYVCEIKGY